MALKKEKKKKKMLKKIVLRPVAALLSYKWKYK